MLLRTLGLGIALIILLSACAGEFTPTPNVTDTPTPSDTPTVTNTSPPRPTATGPRALAPRQQTLPPTFTPTYTPSVTATYTPSHTPTITLTPSPIPENVLCANVAVQTDAIEGVTITQNTQIIPFLLFVNTDRVAIRLTITQEGEDEPLIDGLVTGGAPQAVAPQITQFTENGRYDWEVRLYDNERSDMCEGELTGYFNIDLDVATFTPRPATATPTATDVPETTEEAEVTPEVIVVTATPVSATPSVRDVLNTATAAARGN